VLDGRVGFAGRDGGQPCPGFDGLGWREVWFVSRRGEHLPGPNSRCDRSSFVRLYPVSRPGGCHGLKGSAASRFRIGLSGGQGGKGLCRPRCHRFRNGPCGPNLRGGCHGQMLIDFSGGYIPRHLARCWQTGRGTGMKPLRTFIHRSYWTARHNVSRSLCAGGGKALLGHNRHRGHWGSRLGGRARQASSLGRQREEALGRCHRLDRLDYLPLRLTEEQFPVENLHHGPGLFRPRLEALPHHP
jgi:hypothetical protein